MQTFVRKVGDVTMTVEAPDGIEICSVTARIKPKDREGFLAAAEAVGGIEALILPPEDASYEQWAQAWALRDDGSRDSSSAVLITEPPRDRHERAAAPHPFFGPLRDRVNREHEASSIKARS